MHYISTRGAQGGPFSEILMQALAKDGGLYVPEHFPDLTALMKCGAGVSFREITKHVIRMFAPEFEPSAIDRYSRGRSVVFLIAPGTRCCGPESDGRSSR